MLPHKGSLHLLFRFPFPPWGINLYTTNHHYHHQSSIAIYFLNSLEIETPYYVKLEISKYVQSLFRHKRLNLEEIVYQSASKFAILVEIRKTQIENYFGLLIQIIKSDVFHHTISSSINILFLKSDVWIPAGSIFALFYFLYVCIS